MQKKILLILPLVILSLAVTGNSLLSQSSTNPGTEIKNSESYKFPVFYKGIYLNVYSARTISRLAGFMEKARNTQVNTIVMDVQRGKSNTCAISPEIVSYCIKNGFHPVARVVVFPEGLSNYPVSEEYINNKLNIAETACENGFREIQFDYIRFSDMRVSKRLTLDEKYAFISGFLQKARNRLAKYNAIIAADIFGRIPLNHDDAIGQKMEVFDKVVDIICPMAYPSHYTWSNKLMADPYHTVYITSKSARERTKNAKIVTYIQAFQMKISKSNLTYAKYIEEQLKAVHDSGIKGYILWNASQNYDVPFKVMGDYYKNSQEAALNAESKKQKTSPL